MSTIKSRRRLYPALALAFVMLAASAQTLPAGAMTASEVISLLKAGVGEKVILAQTRAAGSRASLGARDILALKDAGASDELLEALIGGTSGTTTAVSTKGGLRVYKETGPDGREILHVTNLDESGRRLGGELPPQPPARAAQSSTGHDEAHWRDAPIVVNVYPPSPERVDGSQGGYDEGAVIRMGGVYPGYLGLPGTGFCNGCPGRGRDHHRPARFDDGGLFSRPPAIDTRPFKAGTAAQRNRTHFGN